MCIMSYTNMYATPSVSKDFIKVPSIRLRFIALKYSKLKYYVPLPSVFNYYNHTNHCKQCDQNLLTRAKLRLMFYLISLLSNASWIFMIMSAFKSAFKHHFPTKSFPSCAQMQLYPKQKERRDSGASK